MVKDGTILETPKLKVTGVNIVSYSTPDYLKKVLKPVLDIALDGGESELREYIFKEREEFGKVDPVDFCRIAKVNNLNYVKKDGVYKRQKEDGTWLTAPLGSTAALEHNRIVQELDITGRFPLIERGDSISYVYVQEPNKYKIVSAIGWTDPKFSKEIGLSDIADYDKHWEKDFLNKIDIIIKPLGWNIHKETEDLDVW
jgi:hypothetical protein